MKTGCSACQGIAVYLVGDHSLCYFCARQTIFDMARGSNVKFWQDGTVRNMQVISFTRTESKIRVPIVVYSLGLGEREVRK